MDLVSSTCDGFRKVKTDWLMAWPSNHKVAVTFAPISLKCDLALRKSSSDFGLSIVTVSVCGVCSFSLTGDCSKISTNSSPFVSHSVNCDDFRHNKSGQTDREMDVDIKLRTR
ncbi:hypothetical protein GQX74_006693 [Glossina fuscipes]|nr:hypothetical protein GQX74_006693 [Glossina fuscipes]